MYKCGEFLHNSKAETLATDSLRFRGHGGSVRASQPAAMGSNLDTPEIFWLGISDAVFRFRFFVTPDQPDFETNFASAVEFTSVSINQVDKEEKERGSGQMVSISSRW